MRSTRKVVGLVLGVVLCLLMMYFLPTFHINDIESRPVDLLSDLRPKEEEKTTVQAPKLPPAKYQPEGVVLFEDFSQGKKGGMNHFYERLLHAKNSNAPIHIAYFGDSFIEGDILTCDLREFMQEKYGGSGPGWVDAGGGTGSNRGTIVSKFQGITENIVTAKPFNEQLQAINQRYYSVTNGATLRMTGTEFRPHASTWDKATLFFRTNNSGTTIEATTSSGNTQRYTAWRSDSVQAFTVGGGNNINYRFSQVGQQTHLFGVALDGNRGVTLDNFSLRGASGFTLANIPLKTLTEINKYRPYDLIILHFGLNACTNNMSEAQCRNYVNQMKKVIEHLRKAFPDASIAVFSVSDRVQRSADGFHSMKGILRLVEYQRILASECHVGYLNIHQIMGGNDSMKDFVEKGLAAKDYTHLSYKGGKQIANHIFQSILAGVENYRREQDYKAK